MVLHPLLWAALISNRVVTLPDVPLSLLALFFHFFFSRERMNSLLAPAGAARGGRGGRGARATWALMGLELLAAAPRRQVYRRLVDHVVLDGVDAHLNSISDYRIM